MLYIMRHGKTDWNNAKKLQGSIDIPLNDDGRRMAKEAGEKYKDVHFDVCFVSPLLRARETAELLLKNREIPVFVDDRLREMSFGEFEGMTGYFEDESSPISALFMHPENYKTSVGGAETFEELFSRTGEFLSDKVYPLTKEGKDVLIVGHGAANSSIICQVKNIPIEKFWEAGIENCVLKELL